MVYIPGIDGPVTRRDVPPPPPLPPCTESDGDLVGFGFRLGLYMLASSFIFIYVRGAKAAAAAQSQITMISHFAFFVTLYSHGMGAVSDKEFISMTYLMGLYALVASMDFHLYLAHASIKPESSQHRTYFLFRFMLVSVTSILTTALQIGFWSTAFRDMLCGTGGTSAFLFAKVPAFGAFRVFVLLLACLLFLYNVFSPLLVLFHIVRDFEGFLKSAQAHEKESEEGTYWAALGENSSRHASQLLYGGQRLLVGVFLVVGAELTLNWNNVPFTSDVYELGQVTYLILGLFAIFNALLVPTG